MMQGRASLEGRRVLVVEDEAVEALMLEDLLAQAGCVVIGPAGTTDSALTLIEQEAIDCAVLDVKLLDGQVFPVADTLVARGVPYSQRPTKLMLLAHATLRPRALRRSTTATNCSTLSRSS
jgi:CheY-like chemotaxis protein